MALLYASWLPGAADADATRLRRPPTALASSREPFPLPTTMPLLLPSPIVLAPAPAPAAPASANDIAVADMTVRSRRSYASWVVCVDTSDNNAQPGICKYSPFCILAGISTRCAPKCTVLTVSLG